MIAALVLAAAVAAPAFEHARAIIVTTSGLVSLEVPQSIDGGPDASYPNLRVADERDAEVPYALDPASAAATEQSLQVSDVGFVPGKYTEAIVDFGERAPLHDSLRIDTPQPTFYEHVDVALSDDRKTWKNVAGELLIYRVAPTGDSGSQTLNFPEAHARYARIRILDASRAFPVSGAHVEAHPVPQALYAMVHRDTVETRPHETLVTIDVGTDNADIAALAFSSSTPTFSRDVDIEQPQTSTDSNGATVTTYEQVATSHISRYGQGVPELTAQAATRGRVIRLRIHNGDDAPLAALSVAVLGHRHRVVFRADMAHAYRLLWGASAQAPAYDLADQLAHTSWSAHAARLAGDARVTIATPQTDQPSLMQRFGVPAALAIACLVLGGIALSALRKAPEQ